MFHRYSKLIKVTKDLQVIWKRIPYQTYAVITQYGPFSDYATTLCQNLSKQGFNILLISNNKESGDKLID